MERFGLEIFLSPQKIKKKFSKNFLNLPKDTKNFFQEEKFLLLIQPPPNENSSESGGGMRFYAESIGITKELINLEGIKLAAMHDIDMKQGEWENIICGKKENNNLKNIIGNKSSLFFKIIFWRNRREGAH